jgi:hypothetical protein
MREEVECVKVVRRCVGGWVVDDKREKIFRIEED